MIGKRNNFHLVSNFSLRLSAIRCQKAHAVIASAKITTMMMNSSAEDIIVIVEIVS